jgi:2-methylcitrate dehydratase PrpD
MSECTIAEAFGEFAADTTYASLPPAVVDAIKIRVLDQFGAALAGYSIGTVDRMLAIVEGDGPATFWGSGRRGTRRDAALVNAFMAHACYMEDGSRYTGGHAACVVIPPAFVLAETMHASGRALIAATAVGYEVFLRLGRAMYPSIVRRGFQSTSVLGGECSAAACASLLGLSASAASNAIALGAMTSVGFKQAVKSTATQPFQVGRAAEGGLASALLAQAGAEGARDIIEHGVFKGFADEVHAESLLCDLGVRYRIDETYVKRHGGCRGNHAPIDVIETVIAEHRLDLGVVSRIGIRVDTVTFAEDIRHPRDGLQAQQSIAFAVAAALVLGDASFHRYNDENLRLPAVRSIMERIEIVPDATLDEGFPDRRPAVATLGLSDGRSVDGRIELARGEPENPLTAGEVRRKFHSLVADQINAAEAHELCALVENLEEIPDVSRIARLLVARR